MIYFIGSIVQRQKEDLCLIKIFVLLLNRLCVPLFIKDLGLSLKLNYNKSCHLFQKDSYTYFE